MQLKRVAELLSMVVPGFSGLSGSSETGGYRTFWVWFIGLMLPVNSFQGLGDQALLLVRVLKA